MEDVLELKTVKRPKLIIDDTIDERIMFPEKLKEANEMLEKHPVSAWFSLHQYSKTQQEEGICISGIVKRMDTAANTILVNVATNGSEFNYLIRVESDILNKIVEAYLSKAITVQIRPQINTNNQFEYEFITIID